MIGLLTTFLAAKKDIWSIDWNSHEFSPFCELQIKRKVAMTLKTYELQIKIAKDPTSYDETNGISCYHVEEFGGPDGN